MPTRNRTLRRALVLTPIYVVLGCLGYTDVERDIDRRPVVNTGVGATVIMPGESAPPLPAPGAAYGAPGAPAQAGGGGATGGGGGGGVTMIGGTDVDETRHRSIHAEPPFLKYLTWPFAVAAYPFKKAAEAVSGEPAPGPSVPDPAASPATPPVPRRDVQMARERAEVDRMARELAEQRARSGAPATAPGTAYPPPAPSDGAPAGRALPAPSAYAARAPVPSAPTLSIADELARLRAGRAGTPPGSAGTRAAPPAPAPPSSTAPAGVAQRVLDRNADGRPDHWIYREDGALAREVFDEDFDGAPDRSVRYALDTGEVEAVEEDLNRDGVSDAHTDYRDGQIVRRRADADGDGEIDTWVFYRDGEIARHEQDTDGDGFRDRVAHYEAGRIAREERDRRGAGRSDLTLLYDGSGQVRERLEDVDGDGVVDVRAYYRDGKLTRRELLTEAGTGAQRESRVRADPDGAGRP